MLTSVGGFPKAQAGYVNVWIRKVLTIRDFEWLSQRGSIYSGAELLQDGIKVQVPMFRVYDAPVSDEPPRELDRMCG